MYNRPPIEEVTKDFLATIGAVTIEFALVESFLEGAIWDFFKLETRGTGPTVTARLSFSQKLDLYQSLVRLRFADRSAELGALRGMFQKVEERRNTTIHSIWAASADDQKLTRVRVKHRNARLTEVIVDDLYEELESIGSAANALVDFHLALFDSNH